jgi:hypothetical protein
MTQVSVVAPDGGEAIQLGPSALDAFIRKNP